MPAEEEHVADSLPSTCLLYFDAMQQMQGETRVVKVIREESGLLAVILEDTLFHPQGGGQPSDQGGIASLDGRSRFIVEDVRMREGGVVYHYGYFTEKGEEREEAEEGGGEFGKGQEVVMEINEPKRTLYSRLHSAGHLLDACVLRKCDVTLAVGKGHHFPDSPYVEYKGVVPKESLEILRTLVEEEANRMVTAGGEIYAVTTDYEEAEALCGGSLPDYIPKGSRPRVVVVGGLGCPCGGTHVKDLRDIGAMKVPRIRVKKGNTSVAYQIEP